MAKTRRKKKRTHVTEGTDSSKKPEPRTFVFKRGKHGAVLSSLEADLRRMMMPNTALNLRESKRNQLKDFVSVAGPLGVSHFMILTATDNSSYLRIAKTPRGPTITTRIKGYSLVRDVASALARPRMPPNAFKTAPLVVLNGFQGGGQHLQLAASLVQAMFPPISVQTVKLSACQRIVLLSHDKTTGIISLRHYSISTAPSGIKKSLKALLAKRVLPGDMGAMQDVSELVTRSGYGSESEGEDAEASRVTVQQETKSGKTLARQSRVRLHEVGPRLELEVVKVEEGLCDGAVLYHAHEERTAQQTAEQQKRVSERELLRAERRREQEANVRRKAAEKKRKEMLEAAAKARKEGRLPDDGKKAWWEEELEAQGRGSGIEDADDGEEEGGRKRRRVGGDDDDEDDDEEYFRQEVGMEPEEEDKMGFRKRGGGRGRGGGMRGRVRGRAQGRGGSSRQEGGRGHSRGGGRVGGRGRGRGGGGGGGSGGGRGQGRGGHVQGGGRNRKY